MSIIRSCFKLSVICRRTLMSCLKSKLCIFDSSCKTCGRPSSGNIPSYLHILSFQLEEAEMHSLHLVRKHYHWTSKYFWYILVYTKQKETLNFLTFSEDRPHMSKLFFHVDYICFEYRVCEIYVKQTTITVQSQSWYNHVTTWYSFL